VAYTDSDGVPITKDEVATATRELVRYKKSLTATFLMRRLRMRYSRAFEIITILDDARVIGPLMSGRRSLIIKDEAAAVNAALRQFKKGKR
jgi:hypothetical protein